MFTIVYIYNICIIIFYIYIIIFIQLIVVNIVYQVQHVFDEVSDLEKCRLERKGWESRTMAGEAEPCLEGVPDDIHRLFTYGKIDVGDGGSSDKSSGAIKKGRKENKDLFSRVQELLFRFPVSPIINIIDHPVYLSSNLKMLRARNCKLLDILDIIKMTFMRWSIKDFYDNIYSKDDCIPIFSAGHIPIDDYYYNIEESVSIMDELLKFQFDDNDELIYDFLNNLYNVLDRKIPKCNSFLVHSPPSSGKNFFFDACIDYFLNKGQLGKANKYNQFAFQDAAQKRIILWNEPNYESSNTDMLKMILGGDAYNVNVKNKPDMAVYRTPVILLTNNIIPLMTSSAFVDRIKMYTWKQAPYLKGYNKKPYPLAMYHLFVKHKIM